MTQAPKTDNALRLFAVVGSRGLTWQEYAAASGSHHGSSSAMLSTLHKKGLITRLLEKREGSSVYVGLEFVEGRPEAGPRRMRATGELAAPVDGSELLVGIAALQWEAERAELELRLVIDEAEHMVRLDLERTHFEMRLDSLRAELTLERDADRESYAAGLESMKRRVENERKKGNAKLAELKREHEVELNRAVRTARSKGHDESAAVAWQEGYDAGVLRGREAKGGDIYDEARALGRSEGEEMIRRHIYAVSSELYKTIVESAPIRAHFKGCYKIHPECAVKALRSATGLSTPRIGLSAAG